ncbi:hypothetical protein D9M68_690020 [compost metagenome]
MAHVALDLGAVALDQRAVALEGLDELQDAADVVHRGFAQALELFVDDHGADAVVHVDLEQQRTVERKRQDVVALHAALAGLHAVLQVEGGVGRLLRGRQRGQQLLGGGQRQFGVDRVVFALGQFAVHADARHFGQEDQLVGLDRDGHAGRHFFHRQVERLAGRREAERRHEHHRAEVQRAANAGRVHLAHQARMLEVHPVDHAHGARGDEVARDHAHRRAGHGRVGQALAEGGFDLVAQLARGLLRRVERHGVGDADAVRVLRLVALGRQLLVDLRAEAVHQHDLDAHALDQGQVLRDVLQLARRDGLARQRDHEGLAAVRVDVGRDRAEPGHEGEIEDGGHGA